MSKENIINEMKNHGIDLVLANVDGYGDSGDVDVHAFKIKDVNTEVEESHIQNWYDSAWIYMRENSVEADALESLDCPDSISDMLWDFVYDKMPGFENNEGGGGVILCSVPHNKLLANGWHNVTTREYQFNEEE